MAAHVASVIMAILVVALMVANIHVIATLVTHRSLISRGLNNIVLNARAAWNELVFLNLCSRSVEQMWLRTHASEVFLLFNYLLKNVASRTRILWDFYKLLILLVLANVVDYQLLLRSVHHYQQIY